MTTVQVETSPFATFPAQGDYSNTDTERLHALGVLASQADSVESLREVALMLDLIDPPVVCGNGHDQNDHGVAGPDGRRYCLACRGTRVER